MSGAPVQDKHFSLKKLDILLPYILPIGTAVGTGAEDDDDAPREAIARVHSGIICLYGNGKMTGQKHVSVRSPDW